MFCFANRYDDGPSRRNLIMNVSIYKLFLFC